MKSRRPPLPSRVILGILLALLMPAIVLAGCGGGNGEATDDGGDGATRLDDNASIVAIDSGGFIEIPEGALPEGAEVSVETTRMPVLPDGVEPLGEALAITATAELTQPAMLHLPIPAGVGDASNLVIIRVEPDGGTTILMTSIEGDELVAATPGFSTYSIGALIDGVEMFMKGLSNLMPGQRAVYEAVGFHQRRLADTEWTASGSVTLQEASGQAAIVEAGETPGSGLVAFESIDLARGVRFYGAKYVYVTTSTVHLSPQDELRVYIYAPKSLIYAGVETAQLTAVASGSAIKPPITWSWDFGDETGGGPVTTEGTTHTLPRKDYAPPAPDDSKTEIVYSVKITAKDSEGHTGSATYLMHVQREPLTVAVEGPMLLAWNAPSVSQQYTAAVTGGEPPFTLAWSLSPFGWSLGNGKTEEVIFFDQPGEHRLDVKVFDDGRRSAATSLPVMVRGGEPLQTHMLNLPATAEVGEDITVTVQARGGALVASGKKTGYLASIDWGDGTTEVEKDVGLTRTPQQGTTFPITHHYSKADTYLVTVKLWDATGAFAEDSRQITTTEPDAEATATPTAANTPPVADPKTVTTGEDTPVGITLSGSDGDGDALTYSVDSQPDHGSLSGSAPGLTYTPDGGYHGPDSFTYTVSDGQTSSPPATVSIAVSEEANTPPSAEAIVTSTTQETGVPVTLRGTDVDGDDLTYSVVSGPAHGRLTGTAPFMTYTPNSGYHGSDSFTYKVNDGRTDSAAATVSITIDPLKWVRAGEPVANPNNEQTEFYGGGQTPYYYTEPRFEGKFTIYYPSTTSLALDDREVDHGFEYWNVSLRADLSGPPPSLTPGETVDLTAAFSSSGTVTEGNPGVTFWYSGDGISMEPSTVFYYYPWDPGFGGDSVAEYSFEVPQARKGGTFEVYASFWNHAPCLVVWSYQAE